MKKISKVCAVALLSLSLCACGDEKAPAKAEDVAISITENLPSAIVGEAYELDKLVAVQEGIAYSYTASYVDPDSGETKELKIRNEKFTPKVEADITVTVTAKKGEKESQKQILIPIHVCADILDSLFASTGAAAEADSGVTKNVTKEAEHLQGENSTSALAVTFSNPQAENAGTKLLNLSHYSVQAYYSAKVWDDAAVVFWVYNPMEKPVRFRLASHNPANGKTLTWGSPDNTQVQTAQPGQWTRVAFSLYDMGITQPLFETLAYEREDSMQLLARYEGAEECTIYIDGVDVAHAAKEGVESGHVEYALPAGNFTDMLNRFEVYSVDPAAKLTKSTKGNESKDSVCFGTEQAIGYPKFHVDFPAVTDLRGFDYLKFDILAENAYPFVTVGFRYLDENGQEQAKGVSFDYYRDRWQTLYLNLDYVKDVDMSRVVGLYFNIHAESKFVPDRFNCAYFDNVSLYQYPEDEPQLAPATQEDHDIISGPFYTINTKPNTNGVCKVATDELGDQKSNSTLLFWTNSASGYPSVAATFPYEGEQDWSDKHVLSFDAHQFHGHYWMGMKILYLDEEGNQKTLTWYHDTVLTNWQIVNAPFEWFKTEDGGAAKPEHLKRVVGFEISVNLAANITSEVAHIYFDNFLLS
ncbi:MAG: hypothetical protein IKW10_07145 [Oscillospiraceae bacterium]|nr:hypothetical protein [Oscillospiraceae bacterium]